MARRKANEPGKPRDWHLWNEVARTVSPLADRRIVFPSSDPSYSPGKQHKSISAGRNHEPASFTKSEPSRLYSPPWSPGRQSKAAGTGTGNSFEKVSLKPAIEPRIHRRVRRGQVPIDADIDLHGMRQHEAYAALTRFILARAARGDRTVLIITGKGLKKTGYGALAEHGVLRHMLPRWLSDPELKPLIAGWEVSARHHGGEGAYYVRLKPLKP